MNQGINISAIERELANTWRDEAAGEGNAERAVTRARVMTLLVYGNAGDETTLDETLASVTERHPARALVMSVDRNASEPGVSASVSAVCREQGPRAKQLSCEQVKFFARGDAANDLPSAVAQLLAPDVPVYLWWRTVPDLDDYVFNHLVKMADRVIIDSTVCANARADLGKLAATLRENPKWTAVSDFTWERLTPWRQTFASFYDVGEYRSYLDRVDSLTIEYIPEDGQTDISPRAILLGSWLAERLGWTLDADASSHDGDRNLFLFQAADRPVAVRFVSVERQSMSGLIASATLGVGSEPTASFVVSRAERNRLATEVTIGGRVNASRILSYTPMSEAALLSSELSIFSHDHLYEAAVAIAGQIGAVR